MISDISFNLFILFVFRNKIIFRFKNGQGFRLSNLDQMILSLTSKQYACRDVDVTSFTHLSTA